MLTSEVTHRVALSATPAATTTVATVQAATAAAAAPAIETTAQQTQQINEQPAGSQDSIASTVALGSQPQSQELSDSQASTQPLGDGEGN